MFLNPAATAAEHRCVRPPRHAWFFLVCLLAGFIGAVAAGSAPLAAQAPPVVAVSDTIYEVRLADGSVVFARVTAVDEDRLTFETTAGARLEVTRGQIRDMRPAAGRLVNGAFWREDPNRTRLMLLSPTGRTLRQGEGYLSSYWIFFPFIGYGLTDSFTIAGGTPLIPEVIGRVFYLAPKLRLYQQPNLDFSVGTLAFFLTEEVDAGSAGILYGVGTYGTEDRSLSLGAGWGFAIGSGISEITNQPVVMVGGEQRLTSRTKLLTENYVVPGESGALLTGGMRFFGERLSADFGLGLVTGISDIDDLPWFPVLNFVYSFGRGR